MMRALALVMVLGVMWLSVHLWIGPVVLRAFVRAVVIERHLELGLASMLAPTVGSGEELMGWSGITPNSVKRGLADPQVGIPDGTRSPADYSALLKHLGKGEARGEVFRGLPYREQWAEYNSPAEAALRRITRGMLGIFVLMVGVVLARHTPFKAIGRAGFAGFMLALTFRRIKPSESQGSARWMTEEELRRTLPSGGTHRLVLGRLGGTWVEVPEQRQYTHPLVIAPTGYGKTTTQIVPNILGEGGTRSLVITDPKRELMRLTAPYLRERYGERVWVLDLLDPGLSRGFNPLAYVHDMVEATLFARTWVENTGVSKSDPFWENTNRQILPRPPCTS